MSPKWKIAGAALIAAIGVGLAVRSIWPRTFSAERLAKLVEREKEPPPEPKPDRPQYPQPKALADVVTVETGRDAAARIVGRQEGEAHRWGQGLPSDKRAALLDEMERQLALYLSADYDAYLDTLRRLGGKHPALEPDRTAEEQEKSRSSWIRMTEGIVNRNLSMGESFIRLRYWRGEKVEIEDLGNRVSSTAATRYGLGGHDWDPKKKRLTIYEIVIPVDYEDSMYEGQGGPVWWGIMFAEDPDEPGVWKPWRSSYYVPDETIETIAPPAI